MSDQTKPLPCPFCGYLPKTWHRRKEIGGGGVGNVVFAIECKNKKCKIQPKVFECGPDDYGRCNGWPESHATNEIAEAEALRAWNNRDPAGAW